MAQGPLLDALRAAFASDLAEQVGALEEGLVALEQAQEPSRSAELLREVFRAAHGLKGAARAAGFAQVEAACHAMESLLGAARDAGRPLARDDFAAMLAAVDALGELQRRLADSPSASADDAAFAAATERLRARLADAPQGAPSPPGPAPGPPAPGTSTAAAPAPAGAPPATIAAPATAGSSPATPMSATGTRAPSAGPAPVGAPAPPQAHDARRRALRVAPERLDDLAAAAAALVAVAQGPADRESAVEQAVRDVRRARSSLGGAASDQLRPVERMLLSLRAQLSLEARLLRQRTSRLAAVVRSLRLTAWPDATAGLDRIVRDVADALGKEAEVVVLGEGLELDKSLVDVLRDPLAQLVRNAVDHGIEPPDERQRAGKPGRGTVEVGARIDGERVRVTVRDDGRGLDPELLREAARRRGIEPPSDEQRVLDLVFEPGFSTREDPTAVSGRGVGLDVVASAVRAVRGELAVASTPGRGTAFELVLPATQYGLRALVARDGGQSFAFAAADVERVVRLAAARTVSSGGRAMLLSGPRPAPLVPLSRVVGLEGSERPRRMAVVLDAGQRRAAFAVEEVVTERELGLEPLGARFRDVRVANGVAVLPDGELALVLASRELVATAEGVAAPVGRAEPESAPPPRRKVLVADDSATTRTLARSILESSGYEVLAVADGEQAWSVLQQQGADLVVSDVEMPRMDGFELTRAIRGAARLARTPVILLTALASDVDRRRGVEAGADAYLVKSAFDQRVLLETIDELLEGRAP